MQVRQTFLFVGVLAGLSTAALRAQPAPIAVSFDFANGAQGWSAFFADHPPGVDQAWGFTAEIRPLPAELGVAASGFMISGNNHSDDLAMALKRRLGPADGIEAGRTYWVELELEFASNAPSGAPGVGGSPGDGVYLKAGASASEPKTALDGDDNHLRPTVNVGFQSVGGPAASVVGVIANGRDATAPARYVTLRRTHRHRFPVQAADDGSLWLLVLTDSAFEGPTTLYYQRIQAVLTPIEPVDGTLVNLSTRANVQSGEAVVLAGFVVQGENRGTYLIRGVGPTLAEHGVDSALSDPLLTLRDRHGAAIATNDDWGTAADPDLLRRTAAAVGAFPLREGSLDAALRVELEPGLYSALLDGKGRSGVGLVEIYEVDGETSAPRLINLSTRAQLGAGENAVFAGFYVRGPNPERILIRAVGPTLQDHGIQRPATDPVLTLYANGSTIAVNDSWEQINAGAEIASAAARSGAFPLRTNSRDAALLVTLTPGLYSIQVEEGSPVRDGIVLVEVYRVP
jgi:hypothetical protein